MLGHSGGGFQGARVSRLCPDRPQVDGSLAASPVVLNRSQNPLFAKAAASAVRAVRKCAPFSFLPAASYEQWKEIVVDFDPSVMFP